MLEKSHRNVLAATIHWRWWHRRSWKTYFGLSYVVFKMECKQMVDEMVNSKSKLRENGFIVNECRSLFLLGTR